jgi:ADP-ribose pyrophosphatase
MPSTHTSPCRPAIKTNTSEKVYEGRVFTLYRENITLPTGRDTTLDVIKHPGAAAIAAFYDSDTLLLLYQYRHAIGRYLWEVPAGTMDPGEDALTCAGRELAEETGFQAHNLEHLGRFTPVPGYSNECIQIFVARNLYPAEQNLDSDEVLEVHKIPFQKALKMVRDGEIHDGKTMCALLMAHAFLSGA